MPRFHIYLAVLVLLALSSISILAFAPVLPSTVSHISSRPSAGGRKSSSLQLQVASSSSTSPAVDWSFLDAVYLITASPNGKPASRVETVRIELEKAGLWDKTLVKAFKTDDEDRVRGCYASHMAVLKEVQSKFKTKKEYRVLILEDNLEATAGLTPQVVSSVARFLRQQEDTRWDVFHLAYMMYVPGLRFEREKNNENVVQMVAEATAAVGTSSYIVSKAGVDTLLRHDKEKRGFQGDAIPNVMSELFPSTRFASYPMVFHRAGRISSLVNPQLDSFRKVMFSPALYTLWERLMVSTGLQNNQLFPALLLLTLAGTVDTLYSVVQALLSQDAGAGGFSVVNALAVLPLGVALWGASLFKAGNTGSGFASGSTGNSNKS